MSLILKGIDMPKEIKEAESVDMVIYYNGNRFVKEIKPSRFVEIPTPHGRLIDASELDKCWEEKEDISEDVDYKILYKCVLAISKYAPTILEAEK